MRRPSYNIILALILLFINLTGAFGQMENEPRKITITTPDSVIKTSIREKAFSGKVYESCDYYWYYAGKINHNQGGFSGKLIHGKYEVFNNQQKLLTVGGFMNGLKDGTWIRWNGFGKMRESCSFKKGKRDGVLKTFSVSGNLLAEMNYKNDLLDGKSKFYLKDTIIVRKYKSGKEVPLEHRKLFSKKTNPKTPADSKLLKKEDAKKPAHRKLFSRLKREPADKDKPEVKPEPATKQK